MSIIIREDREKGSQLVGYVVRDSSRECESSSSS